MRPIDADELHYDLQDRYMAIDKGRSFKGCSISRDEGVAMREIENCIAAVENAPDIDAVPVVRCKDCRHRGDADACPMRHIDWSKAEGYHHVDITMDDYYCSFGERRESNAGN